MLLLLAAAAHWPQRSGSIPGDVYLAATGALVCWVVVYLVYKVVMTGRKDFGMPVKRRLLCKHLRVDHDQSAEVPIWWTDLQVQRAVRAHWRQHAATAVRHSTRGETPVVAVSHRRVTRTSDLTRSGTMNV